MVIFASIEDLEGIKSLLNAYLDGIYQKSDEELTSLIDKKSIIIDKTYNKIISIIQFEKINTFNLQKKDKRIAVKFATS